ncbi:hypothetical protein [Nitrospira sp. Nam80]
MGSVSGGNPSQPKAEQNPYSSLQAGWMDTTMQHIAPFMRAVLGEGDSILRTGKGNFTNGLMNSVIESTKSGVARGRQTTMDALGRSRMAGTPFGQRILADQAMQGESQIAQVTPNFFQWFIPQVMNFATGNQASATQGLSGASGAEASRISSQVQAQGMYESQKAQNYGNMMTKMIPSTQFSFGPKG